MTVPERNTASVVNKAPRLILVDDNIRNVGGHFFELATLLLTAAQSLGFRPVMATHRTFDPPPSVPPSWKIVPTFGIRRMVRWSLGVDGKSNVPRNLQGKPNSEDTFENLRTRLSDWMVVPAKRPTRMLAQWSDDFCELMTKLKPQSSDTLLINTGDDFAMLALANAMSRIELPPLRIDVIFHFALCDHESNDRRARLRMIGRQLQRSTDEMKPHSVHFHATTDALTSQILQTECQTPVNFIPYPTRRRELASPSDALPVKAVLAGLPRVEKGRGAIAELINGIESTLLKPGRVRLSMQLPSEKWETMIPKTMHRSYRAAIAQSDAQGEPLGPLEVMTSNLSTADYHQWLDTADLGLFLYEPKRYEARCSGVLLEMLTRGVPVIVPDRCWLADQVRSAGGHRSIGFIYQHRSEVPELMRQFVKRRSEIQPRAIAHAKIIAQRHCCENTLRVMGLRPQRRQHAA